MADIKISLNIPEVESLVNDLLNIMMEESDRGIILIGTSYIDEALRHFFETLMPASHGKKKSKTLLDYPGVLSSLSAKIEIAYTLRFINKDTYRTLQALRRIRNEVAHSQSSFNLGEQKDKIREIYNFGKDFPEFVHIQANRLLSEHLLSLEFPDSGEQIFNTIEDIQEFLEDSSDNKVLLENKLYKIEFVVGVSWIIAFLAAQRDNAKQLLGEASTLSDLSLPVHEEN